MTGMEIAGVVSLAAGFLDKHGDNIMGFVDKAMGLADRAVGAMEKSAANTEVQSEALRAIIRKQDQLKRTIKQSTEILGTLIKSESLAIIEKMEQDRARSAIDDLKAGVTAMKEILGETNISKELTERFVTQHVVPVRHYMIKASNILDESEDKNLGRCCRIIGLTALVAGYEYMGQNVDTGLKKDLGDELLALQKYMLNKYATSTLLEGKDFDWEKVPEMLSVRGAEALAQRLIETGDDVADVSEMTVTKAKEAIANISNWGTLVSCAGYEAIFKNRISVMDACRKRWNELVMEQNSEAEESI